MYKSFPKEWVFLGIMWGLVSLALVQVWWNSTFGTDLKLTAIPGILWLFVNVVIANCWQFLWKLFPILNRWIFPDLNGTWCVTMDSNWSRQLQTLTAAAGQAPAFDMRACDEAELAPLNRAELKARITQTFWKIEMVMWSDDPKAPIAKSVIKSVDPFRSQGMEPAGLFYLFQQDNRSATLSDNNTFYGAARLEYDGEHDQLVGTFWTQRMWLRAMNTAGEVRFLRDTHGRKKARPLVRPVMP